MKKSYVKLLIFELIVIAILVLNNFVSGILSGYIKVLFIALLLVFFKLMFGFEKDRHRYWKKTCLEVVIFLLAFFILYYLSGLIFSFYRPINYYTGSSIIKIIIPIILSIILGEILRYMMISKAEGSRFLFITTCILFIMLDLLKAYKLSTFESADSIFMLFAESIIPSISKNVLCCYITHKAGYRPAILYSMVMGLYGYLLPLLPNPNQYIYALYQLVAPFILLYNIYNMLKKEKDEDILRVEKKNKVIVLIPSLILILILAYFTSGYFNYHAIVIGSGSMMPNIRKGDVIIAEKNIENYNDIKIGQIIAVKKDNIIVVHRLVKKIKVGEQNYYYTKGDANKDIDNYKISEDMIYGVVNVKIPYIGIPTTWLKEL